MKTKKRYLLVREATRPMLIAFAITLILMGVIAYYIMWPIGIIIILGGVFSAYLAWRYARMLKSIKKEPMVTEATIISVEKSGEFQFGGWGTGPTTYRFLVTFEFTPVNNGGHNEPLRLHFKYDDGNPESLFNGGDVIPVLYAKADPRFAELESEKDWINWHDYWPREKNYFRGDHW